MTEDDIRNNMQATPEALDKITLDNVRELATKALKDWTQFILWKNNSLHRVIEVMRQNQMRLHNQGNATAYEAGETLLQMLEIAADAHDQYHAHHMETVLRSSTFPDFVDDQTKKDKKRDLIKEKFPRTFEIAEMMGIDPAEIDITHLDE